MLFRKHNTIHWPVVLPGIVVLGLVASVLAVLLLYTARSSGPAAAPNAERVAEQYQKTIHALREESMESEEAPDLLVRRAEEVLLSVRVPKERLDIHLAAVIQLRALERDLPSMDAASVRKRLGDILLPLSS